MTVAMLCQLYYYALHVSAEAYDSVEVWFLRRDGDLPHPISSSSTFAVDTVADPVGGVVHGEVAFKLFHSASVIIRFSALRL